MADSNTNVTLTMTAKQAKVLSLITGYAYGMVQDMWRDEQNEGNMTQEEVDDCLINYGVIIGKLDELT